MILRIAILSAALALRAFAEQGQFCCNALASSGLAGNLLYPGYTAFSEQVNSYFSEKARLTPACIVRPHNAADVALALKTLVQANETQPCLFAVRGNGHTPSPGHANIENGVVIDLGLMNSTTYNANNKTASVLPGATWGMVYAAIEPFNVMVAGGRSYSVGVSGLAIGGGNSFYSPRVGMVCDGIVQLEVVLANGDIVYANRDNHSDLLQVHKGGSGNYGIVTRLDLATFPASDLWGGVVVYPNRTADQMFDAMHKLVPKLHDDPYASVIMFGTYTSLDATTTFINLYEYTKPVARPPIFDDFLAVPGNITDTMRMTNMTDLVYELEQPEHYRIRFYSLTFKNDIRVMHKANELFNEAVEAIKPIGSGDYKVQYLFQPFPAFYADRSKERGGNILGLDRNSDDLILYMVYIGWTGKDQDDLFEAQGAWLIDKVKEYTVTVGADNEYIYLDYADEIQDPLGSYGADNVYKMRAVAQKYDPKGVFQRQVPGGFKISKVTKHLDDEHLLVHTEL